MKIFDITSQILQSSKKAQELGKKFINGLVKEQLILLDYKRTFGGDSIKEDIFDDEEEEEIELEPEKIVVDDEEDNIVPEEEPEVDIDFDDVDDEIPDDTDDFEEPSPEAELDSQTVIGTKKPEDDGYIRISPTEAQELLSYKGKIFQVVFTKKNGELRAMNGMTGVRKYTSGGELPYSPKDAGVIPVYDLKIGMGPKGYRMINISGLKTLHINGKKFKIDQTLNEIKISKPFKLFKGKQYKVPDTIDDNGNVENWLKGEFISQTSNEDGTITLRFDLDPKLDHSWYHYITYNNLNDFKNRPKLINKKIDEIKINTPKPFIFTIKEDIGYGEYWGNLKDIKGNILSKNTRLWYNFPDVDDCVDVETPIMKKLGYDKYLRRTASNLSELPLEYIKIIGLKNEIKISKPTIDIQTIKDITSDLFNIYHTDFLKVFRKYGYNKSIHINVWNFLKTYPEKSFPIYKELKQMLDKINENMKRSQLREIVKEVVMEIRGNQPQPTTPDKETIEKPDIDTPSTPKRRRRTLTPPEHAPDTKPKAEGKEVDLAKKMGKRFVDTKLK